MLLYEEGIGIKRIKILRSFERVVFLPKIVGEETSRGEKERKVPIIKFILVPHIPGGGDAVVPGKDFQTNAY